MPCPCMPSTRLVSYSNKNRNRWAGRELHVPGVTLQKTAKNLQSVCVPRICGKACHRHLRESVPSSLMHALECLQGCGIRANRRVWER